MATHLRRGRARACLVLLALVPMACVPAYRSGPVSGAGRSGLECDDFRRVSGATSAGDLVRSLRPAWLQVRGTISVEYEPGMGLVVDGRGVEPFSQLWEIPSVAVTKIERLRSDEAKIYGQFPQGAIAVTTGAC